VWLLAATACSLGQDAGRRPLPPPNVGRIAFESFRDGSLDIWAVNADGGDLKRLTSVPGDEVEPAWSPDGEKIAYSAGAKFGTTYGQASIWVMNADGSGKRRVTNGANDQWPSWSPDGSRIAFSRQVFPDQPAIYTMNANGSHVRQLTAGTSIDAEPTWTDSQHILFLRGTTDPGTDLNDIWIVDEKGRGERALTKGHVVSYYGASPEASIVFYDAVDQTIRRLSVYGSSHAITVVSADLGVRYVHPALSSDGEWIAVAGATRFPLTLAVLAVDGTPLEEVPGGRLATNPAWRPG
jgi:Tol biopolymer transport system component